MTEQEHLDEVRAELDQEVQQLRLSGPLGAQREEELERLFMQYAPMHGSNQTTEAVLREVDATIYVDHLVPVESNRPVGQFTKKVIRRSVSWYVAWLVQQLSKAFSSISAALHLLDDEVASLNGRLERFVVEDSPIVDSYDALGEESWWAQEVVRVLEERGRTLVTACGDGWLVQALKDRRCDAYGIDWRSELIRDPQLHGLDLRNDRLIDHLAHVGTNSLDAIVLTGVTEGLYAGQRSVLLNEVQRTLSARGVVVIHALMPEAVTDDGAGAALEFVGATPLKASTWKSVLESHGYEVVLKIGMEGVDYLVTARASSAAPHR